MVTLAQFGAGRIGQIHANNAALNKRCRLKAIVDIYPEAAESLALETGAQVMSSEAVFADTAIDAIIIASATDTHADLIEAGARAGKAVFCEKPIDLDSARVAACLKTVEETGIPLFVAFNRRFDPNFQSLRQRLRDGAIGDLEAVLITSLDPAPPPIDYIKVSGGLFRDMMIHDFDIALWLLDERPVEIFATGSCNVDPAIGEAGDIDTAMVTLRTSSGRIAQIYNSRRSGYGYDQRIEVHGSKGMLQAGNWLEHSVTMATDEGVVGAKPLHFFLERYAHAYKAELDAFIDMVDEGRPPSPSGKDGQVALALADAAVESLSTNQPVKLTF
ncbi:MAG: inositol 2-dehydrogenase [Pseudomonadota bacterium]